MFELSCFAQCLSCPHQQTKHSKRQGKTGQEQARHAQKETIPQKKENYTNSDRCYRSACSIVGLRHVPFDEVPLELHVVLLGPLVVAGDLPQESNRGTR